MTHFHLIGSAGRPPQTQAVNTAAPKKTAGAQAAARASQAEVTSVLADSGMGGGMTASFLKGPIRQLGSYYCLPIGDKPAHTATAYTAAMALWPLVAPLANENGQYDGLIAENVIIACNSASVRREGALGLMADYCKAVAEDHANAMEIDPEIKANILALHAKVQEDPGYFDKHVKEIATETAKAGATAVGHALKKQAHAFVRIDSTNGTANSAAYPANFHRELKMQADGGIVQRETFKKDVKDGEHVVNHDVYTFRQNGKEKVVVLESRGNPQWVPAIEDNKVSEQGEKLVQESTRATEEALTTLQTSDPYKRFYDGLSEGHRNALSDALSDGASKADVHMLCCTHYPAMRPSLEKQYEGEKVEFIDQAGVVAGIAQSLDPNALDPEKGPLHLTLTVGSQNYGGSPGYLKTSVIDGNATAATLKTVLDATLDTRRGNSDESREIGSVQIFSQGEPKPLNPSEVKFTPQQGRLQQQFETMHRYIGGPLSTQILEEQGLMKNPSAGPDRPRYALTPKARKEIIKPNVPAGLADHIQTQSDLTRARFNRVGELMTLGEARGIDTLALYNDQGAQLSAGVARIFEVKAHNERNPTTPHRVGIMTGFTVVDNLSGDRKGGENDGPPGTALTAKSVLQQGVPVTLVIDQSSEASLATALVGSGLAELTPEAATKIANKSLTYADLTTRDLVLLGPAANGMLQFEIPAFNNKVRTMPAPLPKGSSPEAVAAWTKGVEEVRSERKKAVEESATNLRNKGVTTMITIERPSVTADGRMTSMVGKDISEFNLDMNLALQDKSKGHVPFRIGAGGDGGNEFGTGGIAHRTSTLRNPQLELVVKNGNHIAASPEFATDVMLLGSVSNHCGMVLAMGIDAVAQQGKDAELAKKLDETVDTYNNMINFMYEHDMSLDGVDKQNLLAVDGRSLGSKEQAQKRYVDMQGKVPLGVGKTGSDGKPAQESTHNDMFLKFRHAFLSPDEQASQRFASKL